MLPCILILTFYLYNFEFANFGLFYTFYVIKVWVFSLCGSYKCLEQ